MDDKERQHWVFRAHVADRAGALTSIASAFSNEGISIDTVVGHGTEERTLVGGSVVLTFYCTEDEKDVMVRKVKRLSKVAGLEEHPYESQSLRKSAIVSVTRELKPRDVLRARPGNRPPLGIVVAEVEHDRFLREPEVVHFACAVEPSPRSGFQSPRFFFHGFANGTPW